MAESLGNRLRRRREELGLSLRETARRIEKSATLLSRIEAKKEKPLLKEETIRKLAEVLEDDFDELMLLAGKVPSDVLAALQAEPLLLELVRRARRRK
jgi:transcriptional regulator with XRE-family HTH domain